MTTPSSSEGLPPSSLFDNIPFMPLNGSMNIKTVDMDILSMSFYARQ
jgi:hypothetical protein